MKAMSLQARLIKSIQKFKNNVIIECNETKITYDLFDINTSKIALGLIHQNCKNKYIGIACADRINVIYSMIGVLKANCIFIPLDLQLPLIRLKEIIDFCPIDIIITDTNFLSNSKAGLFDDERLQYINVDSILSRPNGEGETLDFLDEYDPESSIYVYFTSGSTGIPKGVVGKNKGLLHFIDWEINEFNIKSTFRLSQFIDPIFDPFLRDIFVPLFVGGCIVIPENQNIFSSNSKLLNWVDSKQISFIHCVPSLFKQFFSDKLNSMLFKGLKYILLCGEKIPIRYLDEWYRIFDERIQFVNLYGPTETTLAKSYYLIHKTDIEKECIPIGKPIPGSQFFIFDKEMNLCPIGGEGEIYIRTPYMSNGYLNNEPLNKKKFIVNPVTKNSTDLLYKTGDIGMLLPDGNFLFIGRLDRQIKISGIRIELGAIEECLDKHEFIKESIVISITDQQTNEKKICAYFIRKNATPLENEPDFVDDELRRYLRLHLRSYMIPSVFYELSAFPLNRNGKIDIDRLPKIELKKNGKMPSDKVECEVVKIWEEVFKLNPQSLNTDSSFFELGGNSLKAIAICMKIEKKFGIKFSMADLFDFITVLKVSAYIKQSRKTNNLELKFAEKRKYYPVTSSQKRLFLIQSMDKESIGYNSTRTYNLVGRIDKDQLEDAIKNIIQRHEILRTSFHIGNDSIFQVVESEVDFKLDYEEIDIEEINEYFTKFVKPFDLKKPPFFRIGLVKYAENKYIFLTDLHHIITDAQSNILFIDELLSFYANKKLPKLRFQYKDFATLQNSKAFKSKLKKQEEYWLDLFRDMPLGRQYVEPDNGLNHVDNYQGNEVSGYLDKKLYLKLKNYIAQTNTTLYNFLLSVLNVLLFKYSGFDRIIIGSPVLGRHFPELKNQMGVFINILSMVNYPKQDLSFRDFLDTVKNNSVKAFNNQDYPFEELVFKLGIKGNKKKNPLFEIAFNLHDVNSGNVELSEYNIEGLQVSNYNMTRGLSRYNLRLFAVENNESLYLRFEYSESLYKTEKISLMYGRFLDIMTLILDNDAVQLKDIKLLNTIVKINTKDCIKEFNF